MSRTSRTLKIDGLKVRTAASKRYFVTITDAPQADATRLIVTKRTNDLKTVDAELRRIRRTMPSRQAYVFDSDGHVVRKQRPADSWVPEAVRRALRF